MKKYINGIELTKIRISKDCTYADYVGVTLHNIMFSFAAFSGSFCLLNAICGSHAQIDITCQCHFMKSLNSFRPGSGDDLVKM